MSSVWTEITRITSPYSLRSILNHRRELTFRNARVDKLEPYPEHHRRSRSKVGTI